MGVYQLYAKVRGAWVPVSAIRADSHAEALRQAIASLVPEHYDKPIKLEQQDDREGQQVEQGPLHSVAGGQEGRDGYGFAAPSGGG